MDVVHSGQPHIIGKTLMMMIAIKDTNCRLDRFVNFLYAIFF